MFYPSRCTGLLAVLLLSACSSVSPTSPLVSPASPPSASHAAKPSTSVSVPPSVTVSPAPEQAKVVRKPRIGLALGGGAAKGFAHIGVIKVLEANGIKADIVTGTSAGAVVGALYASGISPYQLQLKAMKLDESSLADYTLSTSGLIKGEKLAEFVNREVRNKPLEKLSKRFGAVATELDTGERIVFQRGNTGSAVRASASIPNVFQPVSMNGKRYVDGGLVSPVPVSAAREMGAEVVIAVDISARPSGGSSGFFSRLDQSLNIMSQSALKAELKNADVTLRPSVGKIGATDFENRHTAILEGERVARMALPAIKRALSLKAQALAK
ncbi:patatin-like phospholipase family protein [Craterilacuibacter sp. RT1T]|uniref:patatin-like phospholipase family protein n=1 Tax=Craterilacuibacter sp. RT1T TaxID=2942211 RepID=UPI0020C111AD|nr:patatin-like phospholipase family protein [Craterilacuibacter sp. RT1T]MCL6264147.1 patatin-like phospholipase family protein [Craterilacuibacter sp. RT1T]